jgi:hypothetical protein
MVFRVNALLFFLFIATVSAAVAQPIKPGEEPRYNQRFGIGIPVGLYNEDPMYGLDFHIYLDKGFAIRLDAPVITNQYYFHQSSTGMTTSRHWSTAVMPSAGILWKTPIYL